jgi:hypothetical protein
MVSNELIDTIKRHYYSTHDVVVIDGIRYWMKDIFDDKVSVEAAECYFATIHSCDGVLGLVIYYSHDTFTHCYVPRMTRGSSSNCVIELCDYIMAVPNLRGLYNGDLEVIARVKLMIDTFHTGRQLLHNSIMECVNSTTYHKACKN